MEDPAPLGSAADLGFHRLRIVSRPGPRSLMPSIQLMQLDSMVIHKGSRAGSDLTRPVIMHYFRVCLLMRRA